MRKGLSSFLRQSIYIISLIVFLSIVMLAISEFSEKTYKASEKVISYEKAEELMDVIINKCMNNNVTYSVLEYYKQHPDELKKCASSNEFEYWISAQINSTGGGNIHGDINKINSRHTVLIFDTSASMENKIASSKRIDIAKDGVLSFLKKCTDDNDNFSIVIFNADEEAGKCNSDKYVKNYTNLERKKAIERIEKIGVMHSNTPIFESLKKAIEIARKNKASRIILFSDGGDTCIPDYYSLNNRICSRNLVLAAYKSSSDRMKQLAEEFMKEIKKRLTTSDFSFDGRVYTVGFGLSDSCDITNRGSPAVGDVYGRIVLMDIAKNYGGKYFEVRSADEVSDAFCKSMESLQPVEPAKTIKWEIGKFNGSNIIISRYIAIKNSGKTYHGIMKIHILSGDAVRLEKSIELACEGNNVTFKGKIPKFEIGSRSYCFENTCLPRYCKLEIEPRVIAPGYKKLKISKNGNRVVIS